MFSFGEICLLLDGLEQLTSAVFKAPCGDRESGLFVRQVLVLVFQINLRDDSSLLGYHQGEWYGGTQLDSESWALCEDAVKHLGLEGIDGTQHHSPAGSVCDTKEGNTTYKVKIACQNVAAFKIEGKCAGSSKEHQVFVSPVCIIKDIFPGCCEGCKVFGFKSHWIKLNVVGVERASGRWSSLDSIIDVQKSIHLNLFSGLYVEFATTGDVLWILVDLNCGGVIRTTLTGNYARQKRLAYLACPELDYKIIVDKLGLMMGWLSQVADYGVGFLLSRFTVAFVIGNGLFSVPVDSLKICKCCLAVLKALFEEMVSELSKLMGRLEQVCVSNDGIATFEHLKFKVNGVAIKERSIYVKVIVVGLNVDGFYRRVGHSLKDRWDAAVSMPRWKIELCKGCCGLFIAALVEFLLTHLLAQEDHILVYSVNWDGFKVILLNGYVLQLLGPEGMEKGHSLMYWNAEQSTIVEVLVSGMYHVWSSVLSLTVQVGYGFGKSSSVLFAGKQMVVTLIGLERLVNGKNLVRKDTITEEKRHLTSVLVGCTGLVWANRDVAVGKVMRKRMLRLLGCESGGSTYFMKDLSLCSS